MIITINKISTTLVEARVEFEKEAWTKAQNKAYEKLAENVEIKGFRKGKAPLDLAKKSVDTSKMFDEAINDVLPHGYTQVQKENEFEVVAKPDVRVDEVTADKLVITYILTLRPEVKLGKYKGLRIEKETVVVSDEDLNQAIEETRQKAATIVDKDNQIIADGDIVTFDFEGFVDGKPFEGGKAEKYELIIGSNSFIPGFEQQMIGLKQGEEKEINVIFPENYAPELANKPATFKLLIHSIKVKQLPEINDDLALDANLEGITSLAELKFHLGNSIQARKETEAKNKALDQLIKMIVESSEIDVPQRVLENETKDRLEAFKADVQKKGVTFEQYLEITAQTEELVKEQIEKEMTQTLRSMFVLTEIARVNDIKVEDADMDIEIAELAKQFNITEEELRKALADRMDEVANQAYSKKVTNFIVSQNIIE